MICLLLSKFVPQYPPVLLGIYLTASTCIVSSKSLLADNFWCIVDSTMCFPVSRFSVANGFKKIKFMLEWFAGGITIFGCSWLLPFWNTCTENQRKTKHCFIILEVISHIRHGDQPWYPPYSWVALLAIMDSWMGHCPCLLKSDCLLQLLRKTENGVSYWVSCPPASPTISKEKNSTEHAKAQGHSCWCTKCVGTFSLVWTSLVENKESRNAL